MASVRLSRIYYVTFDWNLFVREFRHPLGSQAKGTQAEHEQDENQSVQFPGNQ